MPRSIPAPIVLVILLAPIAFGCGGSSGPEDPSEQVCTNPECDNGIALSFVGQPETFTLIVRPTDGSEPHIVQCSDSNPCDPIFIPDFKPEEFVVEIQAERLDFMSGPIRPPFLPVPNPECAPGCGVAAIGIDLSDRR